MKLYLFFLVDCDDVGECHEYEYLQMLFIV
jgi:hypothetical protein